MRVKRAICKMSNWYGFTVQRGQFFGHTDDRRLFVTNGQTRDGKLIIFRQSPINEAWNLTTEDCPKLVDHIRRTYLTEKPTTEQRSEAQRERAARNIKSDKNIRFPASRPVKNPSNGRMFA